MTLPSAFRIPLSAFLALLLLAGCASKGPKVDDVEPNLPDAALANTQLGIEYMRQGNLDLAREKLQRAIEQDGGNAAAHSMLGVIYMQKAEPKEAEKNFRKALALEPHNPDTLNNFGILLCAQGKVDEAVKRFDEAAANNKFDAREKALSNAGACLRPQDSARAEKYFRDALKLNPDYPDALEQMARLFYEKRDYLRARGFIQRYERVGPVTAQTLWLGARVEAALGDPVAAKKYDHRLRTQFPEAQFSESDIFQRTNQTSDPTP